ncbi:MAG: ABC transporter ATP-binding protein [Clostridia bacterium]|nr:ABC transporter ATP-binding protein [Clostridia bacterium]
MLEFNNITVRKQGRDLISDVSFKVKKGRITALLGKNGSGKSTLLGCVTGVNKYSGKITLSGKDISDFSSRERARIAAVLGQMMPETSLSVRSLVSLGRNPYVGSMGVLSEDDKKAVSKALSLTETTEFAERCVNTLSGGEKRRVFLALLLAQETPLIILDEPTAYLDRSSVRNICELIRMLTDEHGKTVLTVMHDLTEAVSFADDIAILSDGKLTAYGDKTEILRSESIEKTFEVRRFEVINGDEKRIFFS